MDQQIQLGKYRLYHHLATGGMGEVFLARHEGPAGFAKNVVVKRILPGVASDPAFVTMFLNEARLAAMIEHPNVVQIFDLGLEGTTYFIAMEYVHGRSLRHVRNELAEKKKIMAPELAARICSHALQGLHYAHTLSGDDGEPLRIVHRDVSPDNLLIGFNGVVKVVDFGIASAAVNVATTRAGAVKGKYAYMAPEQLTSQKLDGRADVYAVGVLLYELLSGQRPFQATSEPGLIRAILQDELMPPCATNPQIPDALNAVVMRAMAREREERFSSAEDMSLALEAYIQSTGKTVTHAHVGALLKELFPSDANHKAPVTLTPRGQHPVSFGLTPASIPAAKTPEPAVLESSLPDVEIVVEDEVKRPRRRGAGRWIAGAIAGAAMLAGVAIIAPGLSRAPQEDAVAPAAVAKVEKAPAPAAMVAAPPPAPEVEAPAEVVAEPVAEAAVVEAPAAEPSAKTTQPVRRAKSSRTPERKAKVARKVEPAPAQVQVAAAQEPAAPSTGKVMLRVNPWAEVFVSGRSLGITPMDAVELPAGTHVLTLRNDNLNLERRVSVNVVANREVVLKADLLE